MKNKILVKSAMMSAIICLLTMAVSIPIPNESGYINLGDAAVLLSAWFLPSVWGFLACGVGSALSDIFLSFTIYAPASFLIKGCMSLVAHFIFSSVKKRKNIARLLSGITAELVMISGYFIFESILYGFPAAAVNIPFNAIQGGAGLLLGSAVATVTDKYKLF